MSTVIRVEKNSNYTTMSNYHLRDTDLSLKAKGLLSIMLSLSEDWDYSVEGLTRICKEGKDSITSILKELECYGYLRREQVKDNKGRFSGYNYVISEFPLMDIPFPENPSTDNPQQLNTKELNTKENNINVMKEIPNTSDSILSNDNVNTNHKDKSGVKQKRETFIKPTIEEIREYCIERDNGIDAEYWYDYYQSKGWVVGKTRMKDWKAAIRTWEVNDKKSNKVTKQVTVEEFNEINKGDESYE